MCSPPSFNSPELSAVAGESFKPGFPSACSPEHCVSPGLLHHSQVGKEELAKERENPASKVGGKTSIRDFWKPSKENLKNTAMV